MNVEKVRSPWDDSVVGEVRVTDAVGLEVAMTRAVAAFEVMRRLPRHARSAILQRAAELVTERADALAVQVVRESGKPLRFARAEVARTAFTLKLGASESLRFGGDEVPIDVDPRGDGRLGLSRWVPKGPIAAFSPFNFPLNLVAHKLSPAIAVGTSVVLKAAPQSPLSAFTLAALLAEAGLPDGALEVVHCPPGVAEAMVRDERLKVLSFTGSDRVGWMLKSIAGRKSVLLELGGNAACIVDGTADLDRAIPAIALGAFGQAGQVCIKVQRVIVTEDAWDAVLERLVAATRALPCGDPMDPETVVGPLIDEGHARRVVDWVQDAVQRGATLHFGGERQGTLVNPAVLSNVDPSCALYRDEVFGPALVVERATDFEDALRRANQSRYGLQAGVFTRDLSRALAAFDRLDVGGVIINDTPTFRVDSMPYGGVKDSGLGREGVASAMRELAEPRLLVMRG
ncbi:MAG: aldehyde dehydrogenase family protein [Myxococcales bacterium]|nr:aldehyde dehydrogenase family protein [Myxococcales bacterium]